MMVLVINCFLFWIYKVVEYMSTVPLTRSTDSAKSFLAWFIWGLAAAYFFSDYLARVSPGVMSRELQLAFGVSTAGLGLLSSFFYYPYILMQIPVGLMVDRFSIRWLLSIMALLTAIGCTVFGLANSIWVAAFGRVIIGFSAAFAFVSALRLATKWFPPARLGLLAGLTQALGMWGAAFGEAPVSLLMEQVGWRQTMLLMASLFIILSFLILRFVQDSPKNYNLSPTSIPKRTNVISVSQSLASVLSNKQTWLTALYAGLLFAPTAVMAEFWGPSYLQYGRGLSSHSAAFANGLIFIGWGLGGPIAGWLSDKMGLRKPLLYISAICGAIFLCVIFYWPSLSTWQLYSLFFFYGLTNIGVVVSYAVATEINPRKMIGTTIAFANMGSILIGAILQPVFGKVLEMNLGHAVIDITKLQLHDFSTAVTLLPCCSILALIVVFFIRETHCQPVAE